MIIKIFLTFLLLAFSLNAKDKIVLGLLYGNVHFSEKEARLGAKLWLKNMQKLDLNTQLEIAFYENKEEILEDYKDKKVSAIITTGSFFFDNKEFFEKYSKHKWVVTRDENKFFQLYMLKNKDSNFDLENFKNIKLSYKNDLEKVWASSVLNRNFKKDKVFYTKNDTEKSVALDAFFNKDTLSIVPKDVYEIMLQFNPQFKDKTEIVAKSSNIFFRGIGVTRSGLDKYLEDTYIDINNKINDNKVDLGVLSYVQIQNIFLLNDSELEELEILYKNYGKVLK